MCKNLMMMNHESKNMKKRTWEHEFSNFYKKRLFWTPVASFHPSSVARFGDFSPLWQNLKSCLQYFESLLIHLHTFEPTLINLVCLLAKFFAVDGKILKNNLAIWSHCFHPFIILPHFSFFLFAQSFLFLSLAQIFH